MKIVAIAGMAPITRDPTASVQAAVEEMKMKGQAFVHEARLEPWGQTVARFMSPEGLLIGLSYAPWLHEK